jgi:ADP-ribose pyrophosphatase YjhB (NUDIX family)
MALALSTFRLLPVGLRRVVIRTIAPTYVVGVVAVIRNSAGEVLLLRERHHTGWALPGGLLGRREQPADGIVREVHEETGLALTADTVGEPHVELDPQARRVDVVFWISADESMRPEPQEPEVLEVHWFAPEELPELFEPTLLVLQSAGVVAPRVDT